MTSTGDDPPPGTAAYLDSLDTRTGTPPIAEIDRLRADVKEWSDIAYEMWAMLCNSTTDGHSSETDWNAARDRLRDRFHAALDDLRQHAT